METKHTPGPWIAVDATRNREDGRGKTGTFDIKNVSKAAKDRKWLADVKPYGSVGFTGYEEAKANACLIAAAPDMLKAIELTLNIKDLWAPVTDVSSEYEGEAQALQSMFETLQAAYLKATGQPATTKADISL
jgi:hypothetical protein